MTSPDTKEAPSFLRLILKPAVIIVLLGIIVFIIYPVFADVLSGLGIKLPRF